MVETQNVEVDEDDVMSKTIGDYGKWQLQMTFLLALVNIPCTWHIVSFTFQAAERHVTCARSNSLENTTPILWNNFTQATDHCFIKNVTHVNSSGYSDVSASLIKCDEWKFEGKGDTLIKEFSLLCDREHLTNVADMTFLAGVAVGGLVGGIFSDRYGRKRMLMCAVFLQALLGTLIAVTPWFELYVILRTILGFISVSVVFSGFVLTVEIVGGKWRIVSGVAYMFPVALSYIMISGIAWLLPHWRHLQFAISLPGFLFVALWWILPESPLWLLAMGRTHAVLEVLRSAAKYNKKELPDNLDKQLLTEPDLQTEKASVFDLFRTGRMRRTTFLLCIIWFSLYLLYYGIVLNLGNIGGDLYVNTVISGIVEAPAIAISVPILLRMGRRWPLSITMLITGVSCLLTLPVPYIFNKQWIVTTLAMVGKFSISSTNVIVPIFTAELYPTTIRNIGVGANNVSAGIALILVPFLWDLKYLHPTVPMALLGACGVIGGLTVLFLPETSNLPLDATIKQQRSGRRMSCTRKVPKRVSA
ncbi:organic cation transporter protein-like [Photinus pyralis]|nr:organic cation transporter protein-like [Photinus pyralis]